ncbi:MAG: alpha/beta fold hydrolase [Pseudomonadota bacterium]
MPRLVLLSGWGVDRRIWEPLAPHWPSSVEALAVDWPGYGHQPALPENASLELLADAMADRLCDDAVWVGWSLGGLLATALLEKLPAPRGLILVGTGGRFCSDDGVTESELASFRRAFGRDPDATWRHFLRWQAQGEPNPRHAHQQLRALQGDSPCTDHDTLSQGLSWLTSLDNRQRLRNAPCPVIHQIGEHDPLVGQSTRDQATPIPHAGHCPMLSQPIQLADSLAEQAAALVTKEAI